MRSRRRFAPLLEQLETRVVLSRLSILPVTPPTETNDEPAPIDTWPTEETQDPKVEEPRGDEQDVPPIRTASQPMPVLMTPMDSATLEREEPQRTERPATPESDPPRDSTPRWESDFSTPAVSVAETPSSESDLTTTSSSDSFNHPRTEEPRPVPRTSTSTTFDAVDPIESEPAPRRIETQTRRETDSTLDNEPTRETFSTPTRSSDTNSTFTVADVGHYSSPNASPIERTEIQKETRRTNAEPTQQDIELRPDTGNNSPTPESGEPLGRVATAAETDRAPKPAQPAGSVETKDRTGEPPVDETESQTSDSEAEFPADAEQPAPQTAPSDAPKNPFDQVFAWYGKPETLQVPASHGETIAAIPVARSAFVPPSALDASLLWDMNRDSDSSKFSTVFPTVSQALAVGVLALNAPHWIRQLTGIWGREDFIASDVDAILASRPPKSTRRRRTQKLSSGLANGRPLPSERLQDRLFAESCFLSLLDYPSSSDQNVEGNSISERAWFWAKVTAVCSAIAALARMVSSRWPSRLANRPKPAAPRYTGPTLWQ